MFKRQGLSRIERLKSSKDVERVLQKGKKVWIEDVALLVYMPNGQGLRRFTVIASKKIGRATLRNRAKRLLREFFRKNKELLPDSTDFIFISSPKMVGYNYPELEKKLKQGLNAVQF